MGAEAAWRHRSGTPEHPSRTAAHDAVWAEAFVDPDGVPLRLHHEPRAATVGPHAIYNGVSLEPEMTQRHESGPEKGLLGQMAGARGVYSPLGCDRLNLQFFWKQSCLRVAIGMKCSQ